MLQVSLALRRDGTDGLAEVFWSLQPVGANRVDITDKDLEPLSGSVVFLSGQSDASINFTVMADNIPEVNETLLLTLDRYGFIQLQEKLQSTNINFHFVNRHQGILNPSVLPITFWGCKADIV